jgi:hypothetical protein
VAPLLAAVLTVWFVLSLLNQVKDGAAIARIRRWIPLGLIPTWTFFAPNPVKTDTRLIYRTDDGPDGWTPWREVYYGTARPAWRWFFNPNLIPNKAVSDLTGALVTRGEAAFRDRSGTLSAPYIALLETVVRAAARPTDSLVQFALVRTSNTPGGRDVRIAFLSEVHEVQPAAGRS